MATSSKAPNKRLHDNESEIDETDSHIEEQVNARASTSTLRPALSSHESESSSVMKTKKKKKSPTPGIVFISRVPPGMTPQKIRHLMGRWGDIGKVYAQRRDAPGGYNPNSANQKKQKHASANFTEAWVEFLDKSVAKTVASMLNAQVIGGKKGDRWRDDVWTMKYLSGFKWEMLGEQIAYERQAHQARLRNEITRAKTEQNEYLKNVELARTLEKRKAKKAAVGEPLESAPNQDAHSRSYKQRKVVEKPKTLEGQGMDGVLDNIFG
ncbi:pre-rRNA-processing protein ESF2 [Cryptococcus neoformans]|uniref:18S rRNA factor 2 n=2 Tax=Cryptococcus neoformans TaxID=5207 RepID=A0A854QH16_CRYNE|nr:pre-rRNA-processing protein ESF2 [Cryptococcus neoformans var. grubii H99]AUB22534.1 pre-rRNA-processing protein ESF2 [Cryptococcus neoformans var. grubii]OWT41543.1 pre-rRNA-processing protein ESF2 [Cryptococcus neoformans var. grubii Bt1]OWZ35657.1 pre-rRNA-processing protein ESF2 [Cryptococcus neoformans var. grubii AD2-60a]OWZ47575.1 pre-rRNA-processing protein ESF2 [Cryptococcus neoformans var. grubii C23]OWZ53529.1 pre-rRNA-processing protein ESF2 [Cryptococcus neoformans var. grubii |eukprot:XP_012047712.1 pre-rRNA-processing protein ESF2 [Cryptococcus neoformans var. grubii H99]